MIKYSGLIILMIISASAFCQEPDVPHGIPSELNDKGQWKNEFAKPKEWVKKYHVYEMAVLMWRVYQKGKYLSQSKDLFSAMEMFLTDETNMHENYYKELTTAGSIVKGYSRLKKIRYNFLAFVHYSKKTKELLDDTDFNGDVSVKIRANLDFLRDDAIEKLLVLPTVAGVNLENLSDDFESEVEEKKIQASSYDRIKIIEAIEEDLYEIAKLSQNIYFKVNQIAQNRSVDANWSNQVKILITE